MLSRNKVILSGLGIILFTSSLMSDGDSPFGPRIKRTQSAPVLKKTDEGKYDPGLRKELKRTSSDLNDSSKKKFEINSGDGDGRSALAEAKKKREEAAALKRKTKEAAEEAQRIEEEREVKIRSLIDSSRREMKVLYEQQNVTSVKEIKEAKKALTKMVEIRDRALIELKNIPGSHSWNASDLDMGLPFMLEEKIKKFID